jgi:hypothetical protein
MIITIHASTIYSHIPSVHVLLSKIFLCIIKFQIKQRGRCGCDRMVAGFTTTYTISVYHHWCCEFKSRSGQGVQQYVIQFVNDLRQVSGFLWDIQNKFGKLEQKGSLMQMWLFIIESGVKSHYVIDQSLIIICDVKKVFKAIGLEMYSSQA